MARTNRLVVVLSGVEIDQYERAMLHEGVPTLSEWARKHLNHASAQICMLNNDDVFTNDKTYRTATRKRGRPAKRGVH